MDIEGLGRITHPVIVVERLAWPLLLGYDAMAIYGTKVVAGRSIVTWDWEGARALNAHLLPDPKLINEGVDVLLRLRSGLVGYSGDVAKMFLHIYLRPEDRPYHCFLWRASPQEQFVIYQFQSHVFGNKGSPFVALYALREQERPEVEGGAQVAETLAQSTLVDDVLDSADSVEDARTNLEAVRVILADMCMEVKKCMASHPQVLEHLPAGAWAEELLDVAALSQDSQGKTELRALGVQYCPQQDIFTFQMQIQGEGAWTKRKILRVFPRLFDPLGFLMPYVMTARCVFSAIAREVKGWDEKLSLNLLQRLLRWMQQLPELGHIQVPRCVKRAAGARGATLHVFSDASGESYAAVAYLVTCCAGGQSTARLVLSRGRVAPAQTRSIPRLELLGAHLGVQVGKTVEKALKVKLTDTHYWTDSLNMLFLLQNEQRRLKTFVNNKVRKIKHTTDLSQWKRVSTALNPADIAMCASGPKELASRPLWWEGPAFIRAPAAATWPQAPRFQPTEEGLKELRKLEQVFMGGGVEKGEEEILPFQRWGTWEKAVRVARRVLTWKHKHQKRQPPTTWEGERILLRQMQLNQWQVL